MKLKYLLRSPVVDAIIGGSETKQQIQKTSTLISLDLLESSPWVCKFRERIDVVAEAPGGHSISLAYNCMHTIFERWIASKRKLILSLEEFEASD
jgi:hypothetical protein